MAISYQKLFDKLREMRISRREFHEMTRLGQATISKMQHGETITSEVIERVCLAMNCQPGDIMEVVSHINSTNVVD